LLSRDPYRAGGFSVEACSGLSSLFFAGEAYSA